MKASKGRGDASRWMGLGLVRYLIISSHHLIDEVGVEWDGMGWDGGQRAERRRKWRGWRLFAMCRGVFVCACVGEGKGRGILVDELVCGVRLFGRCGCRDKR